MSLPPSPSPLGALFGELRRDVRGLALGLFVGAVLTTASTALVRQRDIARRRLDFEVRAEAVAFAVQRGLERPVDVVASVARLFEASVAVGRQEFRTFVGPELRRLPELAALEWAPHIDGAERVTFEASVAPRDGREFFIGVPDGSGRLKPAPKAAAYLPLVHLEPFEPRVFGLDVMFEPRRRRIVEKARAARSPVVSGRFQLVEDPPGVHSVAIYAAARDDSGRFLGHAIGLVRVKNAIMAALGETRMDGLTLRLVDRSGTPDEQQVLYASSPLPGSAPAAGSRHEYARTFRFADRDYRTVLTGPRPGPFSGNAPFVAALGLLATILVTLGATSWLALLRLQRRVRDASRLGQYQLVRKLGEGGMGAVYEATHALLRRRTAIKVIRPEAITPSSLLRFEREVKATAALRHPNVIAVFDYGKTNEGTFFYAMEYLDGLDLAEVVERFGPLPPARAVALATQLCWALEAAHRRGLVHRDVKPANLMLVEQNVGGETLKVLDFGLVKDLDGADGDAGVTRTGAVVGTPIYMAPEAITGLDGPSPLWDVYAVGVVLFELVVGEAPFAGASTVEVCSKVLTATPPRLGDLARTTVPKALEDLVGRCLAKVPEDRPTGIREVAEALELIGEALPWSRRDAAAWWREHGSAVEDARNRTATSVEGAVGHRVDRTSLRVPSA